jgi:cytochrome b pre-mRNA-processing protein 3
MILSLFRPRRPDHTDALYGEIVARARQPGFYLDHAIPDTVEGRFEMIVLHLSLIFHRLKSEDAAVTRSAQKVLDAFFRDMDRSLREMGIGDLSVPKKMKKLGDAYHGRSLAYDRALDAGDAGAFAAAVARNVMAVEAGTETPAQTAGAASVAAYALSSMALLAGQPADMILTGQLATAPLATSASEATLGDVP